MGIGVPGHFYFGVAQPSGDLLNVDSVVREQRNMGVPEVVNPYLFYPGKLREPLVVVFYGCIAQALRAAAHFKR